MKYLKYFENNSNIILTDDEKRDVLEDAYDLIYSNNKHNIIESIWFAIYYDLKLIKFNDNKYWDMEYEELFETLLPESYKLYNLIKKQRQFLCHRFIYKPEICYNVDTEKLRNVQLKTLEKMIQKIN